MDKYEGVGYQRIKELYEAGEYHRVIAEDELVKETVLQNVSNPVSRKFRLSETINSMAEAGVLVKRENKNAKVNSTQSRERIPDEQGSYDEPGSFYEKHLGEYEEFIGSKLPRKEYKERSTKGRTETVVICDTHIPDERMDLLVEIVNRHRGAKCILAGDINDFEMFGKYDIKDWEVPTLKNALARTDAVLEFLSNNFSQVDILLGNHDLRLPRKATRQCGPDYYFITQMFLLWAYEKCHGVKVVRHDINKENGRKVPTQFFYQQVGDCLIGHVETTGGGIGKSAVKAHDFFYEHKGLLGLQPFRVLLQSHTHRVSMSRHHLTGVYCYEIGAVCSTPSYCMNQPNYHAPQPGYYLLVQQDGITDLDESRQYVFD